MTTRNVMVEKIPNDSLRAVIDEPGEEKVSVLIEPKLPARSVDFALADKRGASGPVPTRLRIPSKLEQEDAGQVVTKAQAFLTGVLGESPHWLKAARAFVADVNGEQLRRIAASALIKAIRPNRRLKM